jgi:hypothetical protein
MSRKLIHLLRQVTELIESGDQREEHNGGQTVSLDALKDFGLTYEHIPVDDAGKWESEIGELAQPFFFER